MSQAVRAVQTSLGGDSPVIWIPLSRSKRFGRYVHETRSSQGKRKFSLAITLGSDRLIYQDALVVAVYNLSDLRFQLTLSLLWH